MHVLNVESLILYPVGTGLPSQQRILSDMTAQWEATMQIIESRRLPPRNNPSGLHLTQPQVSPINMAFVIKQCNLFQKQLPAPFQSNLKAHKDVVSYDHRFIDDSLCYILR